ncbi:MAG: TetR/AcrR family transcriptional regulator [Burkholderiales bacterium]
MRKKQPKVPNDTRTKLLALAARMFGSEGYSATTMRNIADQAGIEAASIYYHFASKEDLVDEVMSHGADIIVAQLKEQLDALPPNAGAEQRLKAAMVGQMTGQIKFGDFALANSRLLGQLPEKVRERQIKRREEHQKLWNSLLNDLRTEGLMRKDLDIALCRVFLLSSMNSVQTWFNPKKGSLEKVVEQLCAIFFDGVRP